MDRRYFLKGAALSSAAFGFSAGPAPRLLLLDAAEAGRLKPHPKIKNEARRVMTAGPWSVTTKRPGELSGAGRHDFFSEGPYWWPDPKDPKGPYVRRDGVVNPERFTANDDDLGEMSESVLKLGLAAYFLKDAAAAERAWKVIEVWFLDEATRMNPSLEYGQAIRGVSTGRGIGIIDSRPLIWCAQGAALLEAAYPNERASGGLKGWFGRYVEWLTTSKKGIDERDNGNNHATWWTAQVAAYAVYSGAEKAERFAYEQYRNVLVPGQLKADGSAPKEEARTKSLSYSAFNLDAFALLCRVAEKRGVELWSYKTKDGAGVLTSAAYVGQYLADPASWKKEQITAASKIRASFPALVGMGARRPEWVELQKKVGLPGNAWGMLLGMVVEAWR